jgi:hypothetical protein
VLERHLELRIVLLAAEPDAENGPAMAHVVERRHLVGDVTRIVHGQNRHRDADANAPRDGGRVAQDSAGVEAEDMIERVLGDPQVAEAERVCPLRNPAHRGHVDRVGRSMRERHADRNSVLQGHDVRFLPMGPRLDSI